MKRMRTVFAGLAVVAGIIAGAGVASSASAHGWVTDPPSRQDLCSTGSTSFDCGSIKYEPQSVEAPKGSLKCSGGNAAFGILDDNSRPWPVKNVSSDLSITWKLTARHATASWEYFVDGQLFKTVNDHGAQPAASVTHVLPNLPAGKHTILARWTIADTPNAFYSCIDVNVGGTGSTDGTTDGSTDGSTDGTTDGSTDGTTIPACGAAWDKNAVYTTGAKVDHNGRSYIAKWWTRGETPGSTGQWGVWTDNGACAA